MQFDCKLKFSIEKYRINVNILGEKNFIHQYYQWKKKRKEIRKRKEIKERKRKENWRKKKRIGSVNEKKFGQRGLVTRRKFRERF